MFRNEGYKMRIGLVRHQSNQHRSV